MAENLDGPLAAGAADVREEFRSLIQAAKAGSPEPLGQLLQTCRNYLLLVAAHELPPELRAKGGASDLVQETFLIAQKQFPRFDGCTEARTLGLVEGNSPQHLRAFSTGVSGGEAGRCQPGSRPGRRGRRSARPRAGRCDSTQQQGFTSRDDRDLEARDPANRRSRS